MRINWLFDSVADWAAKGSEPWALVKIFGVTGAFVAAATGPIIYLSVHNDADMQARFAALDSGSVVVFNSVSACTAKGYSKNMCLLSQDMANDAANAPGTALSYDSEDDCLKIHGACKTEVTSGDIATKYTPAVKGWEAQMDGLAKAVPLYQYRDPACLVRADGKTVRITPP